MKPGPDELHIEDDEGRAEFVECLDQVVHAAQGLRNLRRSEPPHA